MIDEIKDKQTRSAQLGIADSMVWRAPTTQPPSQESPAVVQGPATGNSFAPKDRVTISPEAREKEDLQGMRRVNLESWALSRGSQTSSQIQKQQGASTGSDARISLKQPKVDIRTPGSEIQGGLPQSGSSLDGIGIGDAVQAQVVRKGDETRRTTSFITEHETPVVTRDVAT